MMPEEVVPDVVVLESQPVVNEFVISEDGLIDVPDEADIEPVVLAPVVIPDMDDEDLDEDEEPEMDSAEPD